MLVPHVHVMEVTKLVCSVLAPDSSNPIVHNSYSSPAAAAIVLIHMNAKQHHMRCKPTANRQHNAAGRHSIINPCADFSAPHNMLDSALAQVFDLRTLQEGATTIHSIPSPFTAGSPKGTGSMSYGMQSVMLETAGKQDEVCVGGLSCLPQPQTKL